MPVLASDVMDASAAFLNDSAKTLYTYVAQLPYLKLANEMLEQELINNGSPLQRQRSTVISYTTASTPPKSLSPLPSDLFYIVMLWERNAGSTDDFTPMIEAMWEPQESPQSTLRFWTWRNNLVELIGSTTNRDVQIDYWRQLAPITSSNSTEEVLASKGYLAAKTAELCARYIGQSTEIADQLLNNEVGPAYDRLMRALITNQQGNRVRRKRFTSKQNSR